MTVSVIIPTFNRAHLLAETIDSILKQTFGDFELIVVDNCSSDNTEGVVKAHTDKRIRYFIHQNNGVIAVNRNYGISKAHGQYIAFCDDDDLWMPEKLERQLQEFQKDEHLGLVCSNVINIDRHSNYVGMSGIKSRDKNFTFEGLLQNNSIACSSVLVKMEVLDDVGIMDESPELFTTEDYEL